MVVRCLIPFSLLGIIFARHYRNGNTHTLPRILVRGGRFVSSDGGDVHFRGVNVVFKDPPWYPAAKSFHSNLSFTEDDADLLQSWGVNLIRLGVMWPGVVPEQGKLDVVYLTAIDNIVSLAASRGMYTLVEPHQDEFNRRFCGEGAPDWWTEANTEVTDFPVPVQSTPFADSPPAPKTCSQHSSFSYMWTHDGARAYQRLWKNPADFAEFWRIVAAHYKGNSAVLAGEVWNEPFMGDIYSNPAFRKNAVADRENLQPFYEEVERAIHSRDGDPDMLVAYEPSWPVGDQDINESSLLPPTSGFDRLPGKYPIYAFHYYNPPCGPDFSAYLDARIADAKRLGATPLITEFNLAAWDPQTETDMVAVFEELENRFVSLVGWQYKSYSGSLPNGTCTGCGNSFFSNDGTLNTYMARAMARPFAQAVAGKTIARTFDPVSGAFTIAFETSGTAGKTRIIAPGEWSGSSDFEVNVFGGQGIPVIHRRVLPGRLIADGVPLLPHEVIEVDYLHPSSAPDVERLTVRLERKDDSLQMSATGEEAASQGFRDLRQRLWLPLLERVV